MITYGKGDRAHSTDDRVRQGEILFANVEFGVTSTSKYFSHGELTKRRLQQRPDGRSVVCRYKRKDDQSGWTIPSRMCQESQKLG